MRCNNPLDHEPHEYLADSDAVTLSPCEGGPRLYTAEEVARLQDSEVRLILKGLLNGLTQARDQRGALPPAQSAVQAAQRQGEVYGLNVAIAAVRRRIK